MGNGWSNFSGMFSSLVKSGISGIEGDTSGFARNWHNYQAYGQNINRGGGVIQQSPDEIARSQAIQQQQTLDPNAAWNAGNWQSSGMTSSVANTMRNAHYGVQSGNAGVTPPSSIMAISNPSVKTSIAQSRGNQRSMLNMVGSGNDVGVSSAFSQGTAHPSTDAGPSNAPSASGTGGTMPQTSLDAKPM